MAVNYQTVYHIGLLDDLHNYFPEILYNHGRFQSVPQLLEYVQQQIQSRVNPFARGAEIHRGNMSASHAANLFTTPPRPLRQPAAPVAPGAPRRAPRIVAAEQREVPRVVAAAPPVVATDFITETYDLTPLLNLTAIPPTIPSPIQTSFRSQTQNISVLGSLLNMLEAFPRTAGIPPEVFQNVPVVPSQEQIDAATTLRAARAVDEQEACAVCQDSYTEGQAVRTINHCSHSFHRNCIDPWFERNVHCPVCRYDIRDSAPVPTETE
jgi:hypothetical protein